MGTNIREPVCAKWIDDPHSQAVTAAKLGSIKY